jgi:hypothetical protein
MTYAQYDALVEGHNRMHDPKKRGRRRPAKGTRADIAAFKTARVAAGG